MERWFRELTDKALRRGLFHSVPDLIASIQEYLDAHNDDPRPYVWTATAESILAKVARGRIALEKVALLTYPWVDRAGFGGRCCDGWTFLWSLPR